MKKIVVVGPVYPFKGGIAHYTGLLYRSLAKRFQVTMVSYKMQYPKFLFKKEQRDYRNDMFQVEPTYYWLHTANPANIVMTAKKIRDLKPDLVIIQWWHPYFAPCYWILTHCLGSIKMLFVCHNVFPHERFIMDRFLTRIVLRKGDYFLVQSKQDADDLKSIKPDAVYKRVVHPTYSAFKTGKWSREEARQQLGLEKKSQVMLFFGFVREYKGLKYLIQAMPMIERMLPEIMLLVAGDFGEAKQEYLDLIAQNHAEKRIMIYDEYISDGEVEKFFAASNVAVLPYESATQSGIAQIAYGFGRPVIATRVGGLPEVIEDGVTGYIVEPCNSEQLAEAVIRYFREERETEFADHIIEEADKYSWEHIVDEIEAFDYE